MSLRPSSSAINVFESHRVQVLFRLREELLLGLAEVCRGNLRLDAPDDLSRGSTLLCLDRLMDHLGGAASFQFRQAGVPGGELQPLLEPCEGFIETARRS